MVGAHGGDGGGCKRGGDFRQFAGGELLCRGKYRQEQNVRMAFYQIFDGGDAPKLDGVLQPDVLGAQGPLREATQAEGAENDPVGYPVQKELCGQGGRCGQRGICALTLKESRPMIPLTARGKQRRRTRWSAG